MAKVSRLPKFYWNGEYLSELETELGDECIFLCLSPISFRMLTDMTAMLLWNTRYKDGVVPELAKKAYRELNVPCLHDFYAKLDAIELQNIDWLKSMIDDLGSRITELEEMDINVTQTVNGCGCGSGATTTNTNQTDGFTLDPDETGIVPPYMTDPVVIVDSAKCRAVNYLVVKVAYMARSMSNLGTAGQVLAGIVGMLYAIFTWVDVVPGDEVPGTIIGFAGLLSIAMKISTLIGLTDFVWVVFDDVADALDDPEDKQAAICSLYNWENALELGENLTGLINSKVDGLDTSTEIKIALKEIFGMVFGPQLVNWFVEHIESIVPADFVSQYECICGATGDSCPTQNLVLAGVGSLAAGDLSGSTQGFASEFNGQTGYHEIIFELAANYCVTIDNGSYTPTEAHEKCDGGVMVASDGTCIRRFTARSQSPFATAVEFNAQTVDCVCLDPQISCINMETQKDVDDHIRYIAAIDDADEEWAAFYRLGTFGVSSAIVSGAKIQINLTNPLPEQTGTVVSIGLRNSDNVWEYHEIITAGEIGTGGLFAVSFPAVNLEDVWSGDVKILVKNSSTQPMDVIPPQEVRFGTLCIHGN